MNPSPKPLSKFAEVQAPEAVQEKLGMAIGDLNRAWNDKLNQRLKPLGFSPSKWRALLYISRVPDGISQIDLARMLNIEAPTVTRVVKQLEDAGWILRRPLPEDARCKMLYPTARAKKVLVQINSAVRQLRAQTVGRLSEQQAAAGLAAIQVLQSFLDEV